MSTEIKKEEPKIFELTDLIEMFDKTFLSKLQEFAKKVKDLKFSEEEIEYYTGIMQIKFSEADFPLSYENLTKKQQLAMQIQPVTKEALEKAQNDSTSDLGD